MTRSRPLIPYCVTFALLALLGVAGAWAQRHSFGSAPPTPPPQHQPVPAQPLVPVSSGMGTLQFFAVNYGVPAPQALTRQLRSDDERTRAAALSAIGAPGQYLQRGHIGLPRSIKLDLINLSNADEIDAVLTVELDQHLLSAILIPDEANWRRIATIVFPSAFDDPRTTPDTFEHLSRSFLASDRYRVIFRSDAAQPNGDYVENEAHLRIINSRAIIVMSFASGSRECNAAAGAPTQPANPHRTEPPSGTCNVMRRWLTQDSADPTHRFLLVTATGRLTGHDTTDGITLSRTFEGAHLNRFSCQPFGFSDTTLRFEPTGPNGSCTAGMKK